MAGDDGGRVAVPALGLDLADLYDGVDFGPGPVPQSLRERRLAYAA